jgi:hypothetical protein
MSDTSTKPGRIPAGLPWTYDRWRTKHDAYLEAIYAAGNVPWTEDETERRELWHRRYRRPDPIAADWLGIPNVKNPHLGWSYPE